MNKDIQKYIANCTLCKREKARTQMCPLQMMNIPDQPFDKTAIDLIIDLNISMSGHQHILTNINHLRGWPEAFPIHKKKADTIVCIFINNYLQVHMCPRYILSDNGRDFRNQLMDHIHPTTWHRSNLFHIIPPQSNGKLEVFHKYLKSTLRKFCENDPDNWDQHLNQVLTSYHMTPNLFTGETLFFLVYGRYSNLPLDQLL